jgi:valyl-tRNA synthetase
MLGKTALFIPGFDHAGISTQSVVEKRLFKTSGRTRHDLGREKFLETVMDWKNEYVALILGVLELTVSGQVPRTHHKSAS